MPGETKKKTRSQRHREKMRESGAQLVQVWLTADAVERLDYLCFYSGRPRAEVVEYVLRHAPLVPVPIVPVAITQIR